MRQLIALIVLAAAVAGCGGGGAATTSEASTAETTSEASTAETTSEGSDAETTSEDTSAATTSEGFGASSRDLYASNVKYEIIDLLINRGASAPVVDEVVCTWSSDTGADCTTRGSDRDEANGQCGYALLPCGRFSISAHAECGDAEGHDCTVTVDATKAS